MVTSRTRPFCGFLAKLRVGYAVGFAQSGQNVRGHKRELARIRHSSSTAYAPWRIGSLPMSMSRVRLPAKLTIGLRNRRWNSRPRLYQAYTGNSFLRCVRSKAGHSSKRMTKLLTIESGIKNGVRSTVRASVLISRSLARSVIASVVAVGK